MNSISPEKILILAANPKNTKRLRLDEEAHEIEAGLERSRERERFEVRTKWAVSRKGIHRAILDYEPQIIHFCGHGEGEEGLVFEDETGQAQLVDGEALADLFELLTSCIRIECVLLNACYSEQQARAIAQHVKYVIGMSQAISDRAAIEFVVGFYDGLGAGKSIEFSYKLGRSAIRRAKTPEHLIPILLQRPSSLIFEQRVFEQSSPKPSPEPFVPIEQAQDIPSVTSDVPQLQLTSPDLETASATPLQPAQSIQRWQRRWKRIRRYPLAYVLLSGMVIAVMIVAMGTMTPPQLSNIDFPSGTFKYTGTSTWSSLRCEGSGVGIDTQFDFLATNSFNPTFTLPSDLNLEGKRVNSLTAIELLVSHEKDIAFAVSSLPLAEALTDEQKENARGKGFILEEYPVAQDVTAIAVHPDLDLRMFGGLNLADLRKIYTSDKQLNWQDFRGSQVENIAIIPFINKAEEEAANQGKAYAFQKYVLQGQPFGSTVQSVDNSELGRQKVSETPGGIYLAPSALIYNYFTQDTSTVKPMPIAEAGDKPVLPFAITFKPREICKNETSAYSPVSVNSAYPQDLQHETVSIVVKRYYGNQVEEWQKEHEKAGQAYAKTLKTKEGQDLLMRMGFRPL
ncbi:MAG: CHAT domain-containing protein [Drouetiella hepatica Uher 2000/2452]|uniref:CHAT domain-containing protein n=1 Tax=Drouetiella hepatica Uher 2000/2452 TaxID=904376 RepID=A0A951UNU1_9CYAN|nr:CHAT domain-containing protein [Drouetiella hepatica Uher 2000/2452]